MTLSFLGCLLNALNTPWPDDSLRDIPFLLFLFFPPFSFFLMSLRPAPLRATSSRAARPHLLSLPQLATQEARIQHVLEALISLSLPDTW